MSVFADQKFFMDACDQPPGLDTLHLYVDLVDEETNELHDAMVVLGVDCDEIGPTVEAVAEVVDALVDIIYVAAGALNSLGVDPQIFWDEVQKSNIAKVDAQTGKVIKRADGKVLKPDGWKPPNLERIVEENWNQIGAALDDDSVVGI